MISCRVCGREFKRIQWAHLKTHGIIFEEYKERFPEALLCTKESGEKQSKALKQYYKVHPEAKVELGEIKKGYKHSDETKAKIRKANKGRKHTEEAKTKISKAHKGMRASDETKSKMSKVAKGRKHTEETRANMSLVQKGHKVSEETKTKISKANKGRKHTDETKEKLRGENGSNWKGGISFEPYTPGFSSKCKRGIRERDNYECQECGIQEREKAHDVHHIDYDKKNSGIGNLILLCPSCHGKTSNNGRDYWEKRYKAKINLRNSLAMVV